MQFDWIFHSLAIDDIQSTNLNILILEIVGRIQSLIFTSYLQISSWFLGSWCSSSWSFQYQVTKCNWSCPSLLCKSLALKMHYPSTSTWAHPKLSGSTLPNWLGSSCRLRRLSAGYWTLFQSSRPDFLLLGVTLSCHMFFPDKMALSRPGNHCLETIQPLDR